MAFWVPDMPRHSAADIPATRVVAGVRIGLLEGQGFVVNPTVQQMEASSLDLLLAGSASAVLMIEGFADFLPEEQLLEVCEVSRVVRCCANAFCVRRRWPCCACSMWTIFAVDDEVSPEAACPCVKPSSCEISNLKLLADWIADASKAIRVGHEAVVEQCRAIEEWAAAVGQQKRADFSAPNRDLDSQIQVSSHIPAMQWLLQQGRWMLP